MFGELSKVAGARAGLRHRRAVPRGNRRRRRGGLTADTPPRVSPPTDAATPVIRLGGTEPVAQIAVVRVAVGGAAASDLEVASARSSVPEPGAPAPIPPVASGSARHTCRRGSCRGKSDCRRHQTTGPTCWTSASGKSRRSGSTCLVSLQQLLATDARQGPNRPVRRGHPACQVSHGSKVLGCLRAQTVCALQGYCEVLLVPSSHFGVQAPPPPPIAALASR